MGWCFEKKKKNLLYFVLYFWYKTVPVKALVHTQVVKNDINAGLTFRWV